MYVPPTPEDWKAIDRAIKRIGITLLVLSVVVATLAWIGIDP